MDNYGILSVVPATLVVIFALKTKKTLEALLIGTLSTYMIMYGFDFVPKWTEGLLTKRKSLFYIEKKELTMVELKLLKWH